MKSVVVAGGDLFHLALTYLGDATQWNRIAQANSLRDPVITGVATLKIPDKNAKDTGGILQI
jgi:nucleoid-associated protein YgaU